ncbi:hypothetical protein ICN84_06540 [Akkermansia glycaniphila]|uniref:GAP1-N2 domain-containing protein n=1 Tax=Akkermansia glycaniphila TaxID=1679444 RepID=UPI001C00FC33|nr:hypothetical protein [Akkermansia glycaniphila]MBT9449732.1 hypothetical protein [Akkermansia glycaniphila]
MACQLIYTSAPRLLDAGRTGFGTVARSRSLGAALTAALERISTFSRTTGTEGTRRIFAYRQITLGASSFHILTSIADSGSDYTGRTNHTAHHLVLTEQDVDDLRLHTDFTPAGLVLALERQAFWKTEWTNNPELLEDDTPWKPATPATSGVPSLWESLTGHENNARHPLDLQTQGLYLLLPPDATPETALRLLDETSFQCPRQGWGFTWTTDFDPNYQGADFTCICIRQGSPEEKQAETGRRSMLRVDRRLTPPAASAPGLHSSIPDAPGISIEDAPEIPGTPPPHLHMRSMKESIRAQHTSDSREDDIPEDEEETETSHSSLKMWLAFAISCALCLAAFYLYTQRGSDSASSPESMAAVQEDTPSIPTLIVQPPAPTPAIARDLPGARNAQAHPPDRPEPPPAPAPAPDKPQTPPPPAPDVPAKPAPIQQPAASSCSDAIKHGDPVPAQSLNYLDQGGQFTQGRIAIIPLGAKSGMSEKIASDAHPVKLEKSGNEYSFSYRKSGAFAPLFTLTLSPDGSISGTTPKDVIIDIELNRNNRNMRLIIVPRMIATIPSTAKPPVPDSFQIKAGDLDAYPDAQSPDRYSLKLRKKGFFPASPLLKYASNPQKPASYIRLPRLRNISDNALLINPDAWQCKFKQNGDFDIYAVSCETAWPINDRLEQAFASIVAKRPNRQAASLAEFYGVLSSIKSSSEARQSTEKHVDRYDTILNDAAFDRFATKKLNIKSQYTSPATRRSEIDKQAGYAKVMQACRDYITKQLEVEYNRLSGEVSEIRLELDTITLHNNKLTWLFKEVPKEQPATTTRP